MRSKHTASIRGISQWFNGTWQIRHKNWKERVAWERQNSPTLTYFIICIYFDQEYSIFCTWIRHIYHSNVSIYCLMPVFLHIWYIHYQIFIAINAYIWICMISLGSHLHKSPVLESWAWNNFPDKWNVNSNIIWIKDHIPRTVVTTWLSEDIAYCCRKEIFKANDLQ